jgi:hypothetical protein
MVRICEYRSIRAKEVLSRSLLRELREIGFLSSVETDTELVFASILERKELFVDEVNRSFFLDEEDVFEQGITVLFSSAESVLAVRGIKVPDFQGSVETDGNYTVVMDGVSHTLIEAATIPNTSAWHQATVAALQVLGELLKRIGCKDEIYFDPGSGNDGTVFLLTEPMFEVLRDCQIMAL